MSPTDDRPGLPTADTAVLDVDGTLVDSVYQHVLAWHRAFLAVGAVVPLWRVHRCIGMGGDRLVAAAAGGQVERESGNLVREIHHQAFDDLIGRVKPLPGAAELLDELRRRGIRVVIASSGHPDHTSRLLELVGAGAEDVATGTDDTPSKPDPALVALAVEQVRGHRAVVLGDAVWDMRAARRAGQRGVGLRTGGIGTEELLAAGASQVFGSLPEMLERLDDVALGGMRD